MLGTGGMSPGSIVPFVTGDACVFMEDLHRVGGVAYADGFVNQPIGDAVVMQEKLHMVVDIHLGLFPLGQDVSVLWERKKGGSIDFFQR